MVYTRNTIYADLLSLLPHYSVPLLRVFQHDFIGF